MTEKIINENLKMVRGIAKDIYHKLPIFCGSVEDFVQIGVIALYDAEKRFEENKKVPFSAFAQLRVRGAILDHLRQMDPLSRDERRKCKREEEKYAKGKETVAKPLFGPVVVTLHEEDKVQSPSWATDPEKSPFALLQKSELSELMEGLVKQCNKRLQTIIKLRYTYDLKMHEIAGHLGINESRVSQLLKGAHKKLRQALAEKKIRSLAEVV